MSDEEVHELRVQLDRVLERVQALEDQVALGQLAARYGPAADYGDADAVADLWVEDGVYDAPPHGRWAGRSEIADMINGGHQQGIRAGMAHVLTYPRIVVDGDTARGWNYAMNIRWDAEADQFHVRRLSANEWTFRRVDDTWRVVERVNRNMEGSDEARGTFRGSAELDY
ncbi:nuclear transport factor 2 family protein [Jatrophihabitans sp. DSM 45814]